MHLNLPIGVDSSAMSYVRESFLAAFPRSERDSELFFVELFNGFPYETFTSNLGMVKSSTAFILYQDVSLCFVQLSFFLLVEVTAFTLY